MSQIYGTKWRLLFHNIWKINTVKRAGEEYKQIHISLDFRKSTNVADPPLSVRRVPMVVPVSMVTAASNSLNFSNTSDLYLRN